LRELRLVEGDTDVASITGGFGPDALGMIVDETVERLSGGRGALGLVLLGGRRCGARPASDRPGASLDHGGENMSAVAADPLRVCTR
jgi:hypothetical protein